MRRPNLMAVIYDKKGQVLSYGYNSYTKTHPLQVRYAHKMGFSTKVFLHAEIHAITRLRKLASAYRIVVFRYGAGGEPRNARPCAICERAIRDYGIKKVEYTT